MRLITTPTTSSASHSIPFDWKGGIGLPLLLPFQGILKYALLDFEIKAEDIVITGTSLVHDNLKAGGWGVGREHFSD